MKLNHVLHRAQPIAIGLDEYNVDKLKQAGRFWVGKESAKFNKEALVAALKKALADPQAGAAAFAKLNDDERQTLSIFARYGTTVSGDLLQAELLARRLIDSPDRGQPISYRSNRDSVVEKLRDRLMLVSDGGASYYNSYNYGQSYPVMTLHPALARSVPPAPSVPWKPSAAAPEVKPTMRRSSAEVALDLWHVAEALREMKSWQLVQGEMLSKGSRNKLQKLVGMTSAEQDPLAPPDPQALYYELLHQLDCLDFRAGSVKASSLDKYTQQPAPVQAWNWVRAWLSMRLWQDGLGVVPDRDDRDGSVRIAPGNLFRAKTLLVWSLCRVACTTLDWLDLEDFLRGYWIATRNDYSSFYWGGYSWCPDFKAVHANDDGLKGDARIFSYWLAKEGYWAANALMVTLVALGLVERGKLAGKPSRDCFRLTDLGRIVFGAPESEVPRETARQRFLTVLPNHEILAYLDSADASQVSLLSRFAERTSPAGGQVQTFALRRDSVYRGLESGLTPESIKLFLADQGRTPLPENVARSLNEWSIKRESLILRRRVTLALVPEGLQLPTANSSARSLDERSAVFPAMSAEQARQKFAGWTVLDHEAPFPKTATADERGCVCVENLDSISRIRLSRIANPSEDCWRITEKSVAGARRLGMSADQIVIGLQLHLTHEVPPLLETAILNWSGRGSAYLGKVLMLQVNRPQARNAILTSAAFQPLVAGHLPPDWFFIREDKLADTKRLLRDLGFSLSDCYQPPAVDGTNRTDLEQKPRPKKRSRS